MGLQLDENTGQISSNGAFAGGTTISTITAGGFITLEENVTGKSFGTEFIVSQNIFDALRYSNDNIEGSARFSAMSGAFGALGGELSALNRVKNDGTITQTGDVVTIQGVDAGEHIILLEDVTTTGGSALKAAHKLSNQVCRSISHQWRYKTLQYQNGFTTNVSYATSNSEFVVQSNSEITLSADTADGETYELTYADTSWPVTNSSSYWFLDNIDTIKEFCFKLFYFNF